MRTTTCLQYLQTSESDEPARNSIVEPQFGQGPLVTAISAPTIEAFRPAREGLASRPIVTRDTNVGTEWLVDARGCRADALRDLATVRALLERVLARLELSVVGEGLFHAFGGEGGVTGMYLLTESHLACHTYPEHGVATINLYCCRRRGEFPWREVLAEALGATDVDVRMLDRGAT